MAATFDPQSIACFRFRGFSWREPTLEDAAYRLWLHYALVRKKSRSGSKPEDKSIHFSEEIVFTANSEDGATGSTAPRRNLGPEERAALERCFQLLHWIAGVSYFKAALPPSIEIEGPLPSPAAGEFLDRLYRLGLAELFYRDQIEFSEEIRFPRAADESEGQEVLPPALQLPRRTAVPVGGGKDSIVTIEALKAAAEPMVLFSVGDYAPIRATARVARLPRIVVERRICPRLLELNQAGAINGHVPVSAILAAIAAAAAVIYGFDAVAMSNERSASVAQLTWKGLEVNHQYSKSLDFERRFDELVSREVLPGLRYFSFLRPLSELAIAAAFSRQPAYFPVFRSCNRAFHLDAHQRATYWCCDCPKCRFVFLVLAPWMARGELVAIFGQDLLDDPAHEEGFAALLGLSTRRPFECVGEEKESAAALALLVRSAQWRDAALVRRLSQRRKDALGEEGQQTAELIEEVLTPSLPQRVPRRYLAMLPQIPSPGDETG